jgi:glycosyltransferase involved in cell wall biosynthesis
MLVFLTPGFPEDEKDTSCLPAVQQFVLSAKKLMPEGELIVLSFQYPFSKREYFWHGIKIIALGGANRSGVLRLFTWLRAYRVLNVIHQRIPIQGLLSFWVTECALVGSVFGKRKKIKSLFWLHGQDAKKNNRYVKRIKPEASQVIAISDFIRNEFQRNHGIRPLMVAGNGITESLFPELNRGLRTIDIIGVGSLIPLKNYRLFIDIVAELCKSFPALTCVIAGGGIEEKGLRKYAQDIAPGNIRFTGPISHGEVLRLLNDSRILLHVSDYEGHSSVLLEGLYSGCNVVSTHAVSEGPAKNLFVAKQKKELTDRVSRLLHTQIPAERVLVNTMDATAEKILKLFSE